MSLNERIYEGAADVGKATTVIGSITGVIVSLIFFIIGLVLIFSKQKKLISVLGVVQNDPQCPVVSNMYECESVRVKYDIDGKEYEGILSKVRKTGLLKAGSNIDLYYSPDKPLEISDQPQAPSKFIGFIMAGVAIFVLVGIIANLYFTFKYKSYAAIEGTAAGVNMLTSVFRK